MTTTRRCGRAMTLGLMTWGLMAATTGTAVACEHEYTVRAGDTLGKIAKQCDVTVAALMAANDVDPHRLQIGQTLSLSAGEMVARESAKTRSDEGVEDMAAREAEDAERRAAFAALERDYPNPRLAVRPGPWRATIDIAGKGLAPGEEVRVAVSGRNGEWITLGDIPALEDGTFQARARIPAELADERKLRVAMEREWGDIAGVEYANDGVRMARGTAEGNGRVVSVTGTVIKGGGCDLLVTPRGVTYALIDEPGRAIVPGRSIKVVGVQRDEGGGDCVGTAGIEVSAIRHL